MKLISSWPARKRKRYRAAVYDFKNRIVERNMFVYTHIQNKREKGKERIHI